jgi:hypothetical protein
MATKETPAPATTAAAGGESTRELSVKEAIYTKIGDFVKEKTGKRIGKTGGREIFDLVVAEVFASAAAVGSFRFNAGFGSLHVRTYQPGSRRLPSGAQTKFGERHKLRYEEGTSTKALIVSKGNLAVLAKVKALPAKSTAKPAATAAAPAEKPEEVDLD